MSKKKQKNCPGDLVRSYLSNSLNAITTQNFPNYTFPESSFHIRLCSDLLLGDLSSIIIFRIVSATKENPLEIASLIFNSFNWDNHFVTKPQSISEFFKNGFINFSLNSEFLKSVIHHYTVNSIFSGNNSEPLPSSILKCKAILEHSKHYEMSNNLPDINNSKLSPLALKLLRLIASAPSYSKDSKQYNLYNQKIEQVFCEFYDSTPIFTNNQELTIIYLKIIQSFVGWYLYSSESGVL